jgi:hypothetical protein
VTYIDDIADDANDASEGAEEEPTSSTLSLAALLVQEAEFWTCAERIVSQAVVLGLDPFRSKADIEPPTLEDEIDVQDAKYAKRRSLDVNNDVDLRGLVRVSCARIACMDNLHG